MKTCPTCSQQKPLDEFAKHATRKDGRQSECKVCKRARDRAYYAGNPDIHRGRSQKRRRENSDWLFTYLREHPCVDCGEDDIVVLEFDHVGNKSFNISSMLLFSRASILAELEQCEVRCANCHRRATHRRSGSYRWAVGELADPPGSDPGY